MEQEKLYEEGRTEAGRTNHDRREDYKDPKRDKKDYEEDAGDLTNRESRKYSKESLSRQSRKSPAEELSQLIKKTLSKGKLDQEYEERLNEEQFSHEGRKVLYEETANALCEFEGREGEADWLQYLGACLRGEEDYFTDFYVQRKHQVYKKAIKALKEPSFSKFSQLKEDLSPKNPLELLILDALQFIENEGNTNASIDSNQNRKDEQKVSEGYVEKLIEVLEGERPYRLFVSCLKDGSSRSNIRIL